MLQVITSLLLLQIVKQQAARHASDTGTLSAALLSILFSSQCSNIALDVVHVRMDLQALLKALESTAVILQLKVAQTHARQRQAVLRLQVQHHLAVLDAFFGALQQVQNLQRGAAFVVAVSLSLTATFDQTAASAHSGPWCQAPSA